MLQPGRHIGSPLPSERRAGRLACLEMQEAGLLGNRNAI